MAILKQTHEGKLTELLCIVHFASTSEEKKGPSVRFQDDRADCLDFNLVLYRFSTAFRAKAALQIISGLQTASACADLCNANFACQGKRRLGREGRRKSNLLFLKYVSIS